MRVKRSGSHGESRPEETVSLDFTATESSFHTLIFNASEMTGALSESKSLIEGERMKLSLTFDDSAVKRSYRTNS